MSDPGDEMWDADDYPPIDDESMPLTKTPPGCAVCEGPARTDCDVPGCGWAGKEIKSVVFLHIAPKADACDHDFKGWVEIDGGRGGTTICAKCGMDAMSHTLRTGL